MSRRSVFQDGDFDETRIMPAIRPGRDLRAMEGTAATAYDDSHMSQATAARQTSLEQESAEPKRRRGWVRPLIVVLITLAVIGGVYAVFRQISSSLDVKEVDVPYVVGKSESEARSILEAAGIKIEEPPIHAFKPDIPKDQVFAQSKSNMRVKTNSFIRLSISDGPELKPLDDYSGQKIEDVLAALAALGIKPERIQQTEVFSSSAEPGTVITQSPAAGTQLDPASAQV